MSIVNSKIIYDKSLYMQTWNIKYCKPSNIKAHVWKKFDKCFLHFKNNPQRERETVGWFGRMALKQKKIKIILKIYMILSVIGWDT